MASGYGSLTPQTGSLRLLRPLSHDLSDSRIGLRLFRSSARPEQPVDYPTPLCTPPLPISTASSYLGKVWRRPAFVYTGEYPRLDLNIPGLHKQDHTWFGMEKKQSWTLQRCHKPDGAHAAKSMIGLMEIHHGTLIRAPLKQRWSQH